MSEINIGLAQLAVAIGGALAFLAAAVLLLRILSSLFEGALAVLRPRLASFDHLLAVRVGGWLGLDDPRRWRRWLRLTGMLLGIAVVGALAPPVVATPILMAGLLGILAVFRRWAWDEEDRAAGLLPSQKRVPGAEDYNNELLVALAAVFMLGSLLIWRLTGLHLFSPRPDAGLLENLLYVASEALESLPIVGNVEVLGYDNPARVSAVLPAGGWAAFALRMVLDILVIGGLLKIAEIAQRIARGQDLRRYDEALREAATEEDADKAINAIADLARRGNPQALVLLEGVALPPMDAPLRDAFKRRAAADVLVELSRQGSVVGVSGLNAAILTYDILITPELQQTQPLQWARAHASRGQALYLVGLLTGGQRGYEALTSASESLQTGARTLALLGSVTLADRVELVYWAVQGEMLSIAGDRDARQLADEVQGFHDRLGPDAETEVVSETRRLLSKVRRWSVDHGFAAPETTALDADAVSALSPQELTDYAATASVAFHRAPSSTTRAALKVVMSALEKTYEAPDHAHNNALRCDLAFRLAQGWMAHADAVQDSSRLAALDQTDQWCKRALDAGGGEAPRGLAAIRGLQARSRTLRANLTPPGPAREALREQAVEAHRRAAHDPALSGDGLREELRGNMAIALYGFADGAEPPIARARLEEAIDTCESLWASPSPETRASVALTASNARRALARLKPEHERQGILDRAVEDADLSAAIAAGFDQVIGAVLARRASGLAHHDLASLDDSGPRAEGHAREAYAALSFALENLDRERNTDLWFDVAQTSVGVSAFLGQIDRDRPLLERTVALLDDLRAMAVGARAPHAPYLERSQAQVHAILSGWDQAPGA